MRIFSTALGAPLLNKLRDKLLGRKRQQPNERPLSRAVAEIGTVHELLERRQFDQAAEICHAFLDLFPDRLDGLTLAFRIALERRHHGPALRYLEQAIWMRPDTATLPFMRGYLQIENGEAEAALHSLQKALALEPKSAPTYNSLGAAFQILGQFEDALKHFQIAHEIDPTYWRASYNIGNLTKLFGRFADAVAPFQKAMRDRRAIDAPRLENDLDDPRLTWSKLSHDIEQLEYLAGKGLLDPRFSAAAPALRRALAAPDFEAGQFLSQAPQAIRSAIAPYYNRMGNFYNAPALPHGAINQDQDWDAIASSYFANGPGMTYFDNFLKPEALASLRRFCLESTIWFDFLYGGGYVGCSCEDGFICPLLAQIAEETRLALRNVCAEHRLNGLWAYKYDSRQSGITAHADFAAVNVNFWLAPDAANLNPENGGLVVWDKEAPMDWDFDDYNSKPDQITEFLRQSEAKPYVVPHRQNRVVLFNSNLFHRTDDYQFQPGYENRRINVTMLYGDRQANH